MVVVVHFDGACEPARGGGVATYGFVVEGEGRDREEMGLAVPPHDPRATNNVAEYTAAIRALEYLVESGYSGAVELQGDSQLVIRQASGKYAVRAAHLRPLWERLTELARRFPEVRYRWVPREMNRRADALSKEAMARYSAAMGKPLNASESYRRSSALR